MRTSLNDIKLMDDHLSGKLAPENAILIQARLVIDPVLRVQVALLKKVHVLIRLNGRNTLRRELDEMHSRILNDPDNIMLHERIASLFPEK